MPQRVLLTVLCLCAALASAAPSAGASAFVQRNGTKLSLDGADFRFAGPNIYWLGLDENVGGINYPTPFRIDDALATAQEMGATVVRSHAAISTGCSGCIEPAASKFNDSAFAGLDYAVYSAAQHGIRLILPLTDNYHYYHGGKHNFAEWAKVSESKFYGNTSATNYYKGYVKHVLEHVNPYTGLALKDDPAIMAWETGNELKSPSGWTSKTSAYIKSLAPRQLVVDGNYGIDSTHLSISTIDIYSDHFYPPSTSRMLSGASKVKSAGKVYYAGEFDWTGRTGGDSLSTFLSALENSSAAGDSYWSLFGHNDGYGFVQHNDGFALHYPGDSSAMRARAASLRAHAYRIAGRALPAPLVPQAPLLHDPAVASDGVVLTWRGAVAADTYEVERSDDGGASWTVVGRGLSDNSTPWEDTTVLPGPVVHDYRVRPFSLDAAAGSYSNVVSVLY